MSEDSQVRLFMPSLLVLLAHDEADKGSPLTRAEVEVIRDQAATIMLDRSMAVEVMSQRGYKDIDPAMAYEEWQIMRTAFKELRSGG